MYISQANYGLFALYAFIAGLALGAVYDVFRIRRISAASGCGSVRLIPPGELRRVVSRGKKWAAEIKRARADNQKLQNRIRKTFLAAETVRYLFIFIEDIAFSLIAALTVSILTYSANNGYIRWFGLVITGFGFLSYYNTAGRLVKLCAEYIIYALRAAAAVIVGLVERVLVNPVLYLVKKAAFAAARAAKKRRLARYTASRKRALLEGAECGFARLKPPKPAKVKPARGEIRRGETRRGLENKKIRRNG